MTKLAIERKREWKNGKRKKYGLFLVGISCYPSKQLELHILLMVVVVVFFAHFWYFIRTIIETRLMYIHNAYKHHHEKQSAPDTTRCAKWKETCNVQWMFTVEGRLTHIYFFCFHCFALIYGSDQLAHTSLIFELQLFIYNVINETTAAGREMLNKKNWTNIYIEFLKSAILMTYQ